MKTLLLIDANALVHRSFHALPPWKTASGEPVQALYGLSRILLKLFRESPKAEGFDYIAALFDRPERTFRKEKYEEYKAQRQQPPDELVSQIIKAREVFEKFHVKTLELAGFEADDLIGTLTEKFRKQKDIQIVILSGDMDLLQLVEDGRVSVRTFKKGIGETTEFHEVEVKERYGLTPAQLPDFKAISGDSSDNIPGISGVGPKTATPLLQKYGTIENIYKHLDPKEKWYEKFAPHEKEALLFKELATIHRNVPVEVAGIEEFEKQPLNTEELVAYFSTMGFKSLVEEVTGKKPSSAKATKGKKASAGKGKKTPRHTPQGGLPFLGSQTRIMKAGGVTVGFELKKEKELDEPFFDIGIAAWLVGPDLKDYGPRAVFHTFLKKEWQGTEENLKELFEWAKEKLVELELERVFYDIEMPLLRVLREIERYGVAIDLEKVQDLRKELQKEVHRLEGEIYRKAGGEVNLNSPKQLTQLLFEKLAIALPKGMKKTPGGAMSTNVENLTLLKGAHPIVGDILLFRTAYKMLSTYVDPILERTDKRGRLHTSFVQTGTATGRLSSENPNMQNLPVSSDEEGGEWGTKLRNAFVVEAGRKLVAFDYSQLELRILASVSGDKEMTRTFKKEGDIHATTAAEIFGVGEEKVTKEMRRVAKTLNFGVAYGMGSSAFAKVAGVSREEAKKFIEKYYEAFSGVREWQEEMKNQGREHGYVMTLTGRRRPIPDIQSDVPQFVARAERIAINMPIQGLEADIIKYAMIEARKALMERGWWGEEVKMLLSIHDELLFEIRDDMMKEAVPMIKKIMESAYPLEVPLTVNVSSGTEWGGLVPYAK